MRKPLEELTTICCDIAEKVADNNGFVSIKGLVDAVGVELRAQPLLYEGVVAEPNETDGKWLVIVDSFSSGYDPLKYERECSTNGLPARLRFTIAHELGHVLQLRSTRSPAKLQRQKGNSQAAVEDKLEREADTLSPLLLVPDSGLTRLLADCQVRLDLAQVLDARSRWVISREVMVTRLGLLSKHDPRGHRFSPALQDIAVGIAEWTGRTSACVAKWPRPFCNFSQNLVPEFLQVQRANEDLTAVFKSVGFRINGGDCNTDEAEVFLGTPANPRSEKAVAKITVEPTQYSIGGKFLFVVGLA